LGRFLAGCYLIIIGVDLAAPSLGRGSIRNVGHGRRLKNAYRAPCYMRLSLPSSLEEARLLVTVLPLRLLLKAIARVRISIDAFHSRETPSYERTPALFAITPSATQQARLWLDVAPIPSSPSQSRYSIPIPSPL